MKSRHVRRGGRDQFEVGFMSGTNPMAGDMLGGRVGVAGAAYWVDMSHVHRGGRRGGRRVGVAGAAYIGSGGGKTGTRRVRRSRRGGRSKIHMAGGDSLRPLLEGGSRGVRRSRGRGRGRCASSLGGSRSGSRGRSRRGGRGGGMCPDCFVHH